MRAVVWMMLYPSGAAAGKRLASRRPARQKRGYMPDTLVAAAERKRNYHTLDALRGVAAISVVMYHYPALLTPVRIDGAYLAVDLFFLMSGFVIAHAYERRFDGGLSVAQFTAMRVCRLYPMFALGTLVTTGGILLALAAHVPSVWTWRSVAMAAVSSAMFLPSPPVPGKPLNLYPLNMPAWSLLLELLVNFAFAASYPWLRGRKLGIVIALGAVGVTVAAWMTGRLDGGVQYDTILVGAVRVVFSFFLGVAMHRVEARGTLPAPRVPASLLVMAAAAMLLFDPPAGWRAVYDAISVLALFPVLVWSATHVEPRRGITACTALGLISYPLYMIHIPAQSMAMGVVREVIGSGAEHFAPWLGLAVIAWLLALSWLLARYVDPRLRRLLERVALR